MARSLLTYNSNSVETGFALCLAYTAEKAMTSRYVISYNEVINHVMCVYPSPPRHDVKQRNDTNQY